MGFKLGFKALEQGKSIRRGAGKTGNDLAPGQTAHLPGVGLDHSLSQSDLAVARNHDVAALSHRYYCGAMPTFHIAVLSVHYIWPVPSFTPFKPISAWVKLFNCDDPR